MRLTAEITGWITLMFAAAVTMWVLFQMAWDACRCTHFVWRVRMASCRAHEPIAWSHLTLSALRYWLGIDRRPDYLVVRDTNETVYWPGREGSRRYPG